jgi:hydantoinase/carbamoylase family amidase
LDYEHQGLHRPSSDPLSSVLLQPGHYSAFLELHIEQGPHLDATGIDIGIVEKIAAPAAFRLTLTGTGGHAGAVLMPDRHDAFLAAAEIALAVESAALNSPSPDTVGTVGKVEVRPGAINSIPNHVLIEIDFRDTDLTTRDQAIALIQSTAEKICQRRGVSLSWRQINADPPATCDPALVTLIESATTTLGYSHQRMISRAYHDSLFMARVAPTGMVFVPCRNGWSHRPDEFASAKAVGDGVGVLALAMADLAEGSWGVGGRKGAAGDRQEL